MPSKLALCLAAGLLVPASAHAVMFWDDATAAKYGVERPPNWASDKDCNLEITSPRWATAGTTATFDIYAVSVAYGARSPAPSVDTWTYDENWTVIDQSSINLSLEDEFNNAPAKLTYSSPVPARHIVYLYAPESWDKYYWYDQDNDQWISLGERWCEGFVTIDWVPPSDETTSGKVTGGGWLEPKRKVFGLTAQKQADEPAPKGQFTYIDSTVGLRFHSTAITSLQTVGNTTVVQGTGELADGTVATFTVQATDNGEPGTLDTIDITIGAYHASGPLAGGNIAQH